MSLLLVTKINISRVHVFAIYASCMAFRRLEYSTQDPALVLLVETMPIRCRITTQFLFQHDRTLACHSGL